MTHVTLLLLSVLSSSMINMVEGKNVVFLPCLSTSHAKVHGLVAAELVKMGHQAWLALPSAHEKRKDEVYPRVNTFSCSTFMNVSEDNFLIMVERSINGQIGWEWLQLLEDVISAVFVRAMAETNLTSYVRDIRPDLIVLDWWPFMNELVALSYQLDVPFAILSALVDPNGARIPFNPIAKASDSLYFQEKASLFEQARILYNTIHPLIRDLFSDRHLINRVAPTKPYIPTIDLMSQAEVYIVERDPVIDYPQPSLPNVKWVGAVTSSAAKPLQEPFRSFVARSEESGRGIVVVSFGSLVLRLKEETETKLMAALRRLDVNVVWRTSVVSPDTETVLTSSWIPQNDLLGHNNTKVFISHCGAHGQYEALYHAVPLVCVPLFYDQFYNAERVHDKHLGLTLNLDKASEEEVYMVIREVMLGDKIRPSMEKASEIYHQLYKNPRQEAAFWLDHVMKYGGSYMRYSGQKMSWKLYVLGDCLLFIAGVAVSLVVCLTMLALYCVCRRCRRQGHVKTD